MMARYDAVMQGDLIEGQLEFRRIHQAVHFVRNGRFFEVDGRRLGWPISAAVIVRTAIFDAGVHPSEGRRGHAMSEGDIGGE